MVVLYVNSLVKKEIDAGSLPAVCLAEILKAGAAPYSLDHCHLSEAGNILVAQGLTSELIPYLRPAES